MANRLSRIILPVYAPWPDGLYRPPWPKGAIQIAAAAAIASAGSGTLTNAAGVAFNDGDAVTISGSWTGYTKPNSMFSKSQIEGTNVGNTPNFGNNHGSGGGTDFNWSRFSDIGVVLLDGSRGKVFGNTSTTECAQEANFTDVPTGGKKYNRYVARYQSTFISDSPDAQVKFKRFAVGPSNITDDPGGQWYRHYNHLGGINHILELNYPTTGSGHHTYYGGDNPNLEQQDGVWRLCEDIFYAPSAQGASDGTYGTRCITAGAAIPAFQYFSESTYGTNTNGGFPCYPGTGRFNAVMLQNWASNGRSALNFAIDDWYVADWGPYVELCDTATGPSAHLPEIQPLTALVDGLASITLNKGGFPSGTGYLILRSDPLNRTLLGVRQITVN